MLNSILAVVIGLAAVSAGNGSSASSARRPTIVLVHGAFAESASWNGVAGELARRGYSVVAAPDPLRGPLSDGSYVSSLVRSTKGPVVLVGHSYGGSVISVAAKNNANVKGLVFVAAFALDQGESVATMSARFPEGTLGSALAAPVPLSTGGNDLYIDQNKFWQQFAADVPEADARVMAMTQRPIAETALTETMQDPAWKRIPSWFIYGTGDRNIPKAALAFMAKRAGSRETIEIEGASHVVMISHASAVADLIDRAATASQTLGLTPVLGHFGPSAYVRNGSKADNSPHLVRAVESESSKAP